MCIKAKSGMLISKFTGLSNQQEIIQKPGTKYRPIGLRKERGRGGQEVIIADFEEV